MVRFSWPGIKNRKRWGVKATKPARAGMHADLWGSNGLGLLGDDGFTEFGRAGEFRDLF
jgi:hypothetical protein